MPSVFIEIQGIKGDVAAQTFKSQIAITSVSFSMSRSIKSAVGSDKDRESSNPFISECVFTKEVDSSSNPIWLKAFKNMSLGTCTISFARTADGGMVYRKVELKECLVSQIQCENAGDTRPHEQISLNFTEITVTDATSDAKNIDDTNSHATYDLPGMKSS